jgi:O-antigen/teichoic acid export membrane protein
VRVFLVDVVAIVLFAALGRRNHGEGTAAAGVLVVAAPFLVGWTLAWFVSRLHRTPSSPRRATLALAVALPIALLLRAATGRGDAPAFVVVAVVFLGLALVGRRWLVARLARRRARTDTPPAGATGEHP